MNNYTVKTIVSDFIETTMILENDKSIKTVVVYQGGEFSNDLDSLINSKMVLIENDDLNYEVTNIELENGSKQKETNLILEKGSEFKKDKLSIPEQFDNITFSGIDETLKELVIKIIEETEEKSEKKENFNTLNK